MLHSRYHDNPDMVSNLLEESDDDDALIDPANLEYTPPHRLALNDQDDDDPLCTSLLNMFIIHAPSLLLFSVVNYGKK